MTRTRLRALPLLALTTLLVGCEQDTILGFAIGDISGLWIGMSYVYTEVTPTQAPSVDLIERDGARFTMVVDNMPRPPIVSTTFADGMGNEVSGGGTIDIVVGTMLIRDVLYTIDHDGDRMTITTDEMMFDFGSGMRPAVLTIVLDRA